MNSTKRETDPLPAPTAAEGVSIEQASQTTGLSIDTLRYYEKIGLIAPVKRDSGRHRLYSESDLQSLMYLRRMRATGMPIRALQKYAALHRAGELTEADRQSLLRAQRDAVVAKIEELQAHLAVIDHKMALHAGAAVETGQCLKPAQKSPCLPTRIEEEPI